MTQQELQTKYDLDEAIKNLREDFAGIHNEDISFKNVLRYYENVGPKLIEYASKQPLKYYDSYPFDWTQLFTPIEQHAWNIIRSIGRIVMYPQYPVLRYRPDFANPLLKIILECDGKQWHDKDKDRERDRVLFSAGWRVYRVTGSELYIKIDLVKNEDIGIDDSEDLYTYESLRDYYMNTAEGVIDALRAVYFAKNNEPWTNEGNLQIKTLEAHRLIDFPLL